MNNTPTANRLHIALYGRRNSGKSTLINALTGQDVALVSNIAGTTTDPVQKAMEVHPLGACVFIDTPGFDDDDERLGALRVERTMQTLDRADLAILLCEDGGEEEQAWLNRLHERKIGVVTILNKADNRGDVTEQVELIAQKCGGERPIVISALHGEGLADLKDALLRKMPEDFGRQSITGNLVEAGDVVVLVMPQDIQAPKGRLILPQVQTLRELLDKRCIALCCTTEQLPQTLATLRQVPKLIITDSQAFGAVYPLKPEGSLLTSFSVLFAAYKGDIDYFVESARAIARLCLQSKVLIAEACTHAPLSEDIGRVKLPRLLRKKVGESLQIDMVSGRDFPKNLKEYDLVIHCGACMFNRKLVLSRVEQARREKVAMTNYGVAIAALTGILDKVAYRH